MANEKRQSKHGTGGQKMASEDITLGERINASKRFCMADYPVSNHLENPFKQRYCKQFSADYRVKKGHFIDKKEAEKLNQMTTDELVRYWGERREGE